MKPDFLQKELGHQMEIYLSIHLREINPAALRSIHNG